MRAGQASREAAFYRLEMAPDSLGVEQDGNHAQKAALPKIWFPRVETNPIQCKQMDGTCPTFFEPAE